MTAAANSPAPLLDVDGLSVSFLLANRHEERNSPLTDVFE